MKKSIKEKQKHRPTKDTLSPIYLHITKHNLKKVIYITLLFQWYRICQPLVKYILLPTGNTVTKQDIIVWD
jgi:hypothetical protein